MRRVDLRGCGGSCAVIVVAACRGMRSTAGDALRGHPAERAQPRRRRAGAAERPPIRPSARYVAEHGDAGLRPGRRHDRRAAGLRPPVGARVLPPAGGGPPSTVSEATPLPSALLQMLPSDLRAGTAPPLQPFGPNCWTVPAGEPSCRTCCQGPDGVRRRVPYPAPVSAAVTAAGRSGSTGTAGCSAPRRAR